MNKQPELAPSRLKKSLRFVLAGGLIVQMMGASCMQVVDPVELTLDVKAISATYDIPPGTVSFGAPGNCTVVSPGQYLTTELDISNVRVTGVSLQTVGVFSGSVSDGAVSINGVSALGFSGSWSDFNTPRVLGTGSQLNTNQAGMDALILAVRRREPVTVCTNGTFDGAAPAGLKVTVEFHTQVDVTP